MDGKPSDSIARLPEALTERELEILVCLADGLSNQEIANKLYLAAQTVRWYNSQIYGKLGVSNRQEAIERAQALGLLSEETPVQMVTGKHNLPAQATPFVGRQHELVELTGLLKDDNIHLTTILAPGGMGKTRLVLEVARLQIGRYVDGVIFVPLAPLDNPNDIITAIAENIGFVFYGENAPAEQLIDFLRDRSMLLVLDNFEHLLDGVQLIADMLQGAPQVRIMTTSRERLNLRGETVYSLRGLEFPTWETPEDALQYDAVKLFMQSAHRIRADFELQAHELDYLARICRLTAGMPLGIELAAGWIDVLSLEEIAAEIQKGIDILETEMHDVPERQRSIRATFDHTWERLTEDEKTVFMRLSIFRGGFTVTAAQAIAGADVRSLRHLANKALVQVSPDNRHDIHELLRQFGVEKLTASGEQTDIQAKHAAYFAAFMEERKQDINTNRQIEALNLIDPDFENVRSAWLYVVNHQEWDQLPKLLHSIWFYLDMRTRGQGAIELLEPAVKILQSISSSDITQLALGRVLARLGWFNNDIGLSEKGAALCDEAIGILRQYGNVEDLMVALFNRGLIGMFLNQFALVTGGLCQEGLAFARQVGDKTWEALFLTWLGASHIYDNPDLALELNEKALATIQPSGNLWGLLSVYVSFTMIKEAQKDYEQTVYWVEQLRSVAQSLGNIFLVARSYVIQGKVSLLQHDYASARLNLGKGLQIYWDAGYKWLAAFPMVYIAQFFADQSQVERAIEVRAVVDKQLIVFEQTDEVAKDLRNQLETVLEPERFAAAWARGEKRELSAVVAELLAEFCDER